MLSTVSFQLQIISAKVELTSLPNIVRPEKAQLVLLHLRSLLLPAIEGRVVIRFLVDQSLPNGWVQKSGKARSLGSGC